VAAAKVEHSRIPIEGVEHRSPAPRLDAVDERGPGVGARLSNDPLGVVEDGCQVGVLLGGVAVDEPDLDDVRQVRHSVSPTRQGDTTARGTSPASSITGSVTASSSPGHHAHYAAAQVRNRLLRSYPHRQCSGQTSSGVVLHPAATSHRRAG